MSDLVLVEVSDGVGVVRLNRLAERNALNAALRAEIPEALDAREDVGALILTGADPAFCAGLDLGELSQVGFSQSESAGAGRTERLPFGNLTKPLIGAINGAAVTGGFEYALCCDLLIASERARFADTHARVNVMPGWGMTFLLPEAIGVRRARQMSFTGNFIDAETALAWGLVNQVVPHEELMPVAKQLASDMASVRPASLRQLKRVYREVGDEPGTPAALAREKQHSRDWLARFKPTELNEERRALQARGRQQSKE